MLDAVSADLVQLGHQVVTPVDRRTPGLHQATDTIWIESESEFAPKLRNAAEVVEKILFIAPESDSRLLRCCELWMPWASKWICPDIQFVKLCSDKTATIELLAENGVSTCDGFLLEEIEQIKSRGLPSASGESAPRRCVADGFWRNSPSMFAGRRQSCSVGG